jgi:aminopeptidase-like protein
LKRTYFFVIAKRRTFQVLVVRAKGNHVPSQSKHLCRCRDREKISSGTNNYRGVKLRERQDTRAENHLMSNQISCAPTVDFAATLGHVDASLYDLIRELYPICRSITGDGFRQTMKRLSQQIPLQVQEVPTGTRVFDWTVPREWNIRDAYVKNSKGERVIDFRRHNLHVVNYSVPVHRQMSLEELKPHLHSLPDRPEWIPYRTSYYTQSWGFCLSHRQLEHMREDRYEVCIDSTLEDGSLTYGEYYLKGESNDEVLISVHACHPSLCNDNLSGISVSTFLAAHLSRFKPRYSYRFLFIPGTIGAITWLSCNEEHVPTIKHGLVLTCIGDRGQFTYKKSRRGDAEIDRAIAHVLAHSGRPYKIVDYSPYGYDERQYCSPAFNLAVGCLMRSPHGQFPEYHTSADNLDFVDPESLASSLQTILAVLQVLEDNRTYLNLNPKCEPQLGRRGLYGAIGGASPREFEMGMLWVLNLSDGGATLLDIAERSQMDCRLLARAATALAEVGLLQEVAHCRAHPSGSR